MSRPTLPAMLEWLDNRIGLSESEKIWVKAIRDALVEKNDRTLPVLPEDYIIEELCQDINYPYEWWCDIWGSVRVRGIGPTPRFAVLAAISKIPEAPKDE